jgi:hypothetical protein
MILAEKSLSYYKAKGLDRTFTIKCMSGKVNRSIKRVVSDTINKNSKLKELCKELLDFRKLMLCYRLIHYSDELPEIETNLYNRDLELTEPILQLFYGTECFNEIIEALEYFISQRMARKVSSLEAILYKIVKAFVDNSQLQKPSSKYVSIQYSEIWFMITNGEIAGTYNPSKPNEYETTNYGTIYNNTLSKIIEDQFGATLEKNTKGSVVKIDVEKFRKVEKVYSNDAQQLKIKVWLKDSKDENTNVEDNDGYDGYDGSSDGIDNNNKSNHNSNIENQAQNELDKIIKTNESNTNPLLEPSLPSLPSYCSPSTTEPPVRG